MHSALPCPLDTTLSRLHPRSQIMTGTRSSSHTNIARYALDEGTTLEVHHAMHKAGKNPDGSGDMVVKLYIRQPAGVNYSLPSTVGAANYHWEDLEHGTKAAFQYGGAQGKTGLFDLTCADGYSAGQGAHGIDPNISKIIEYPHLRLCTLARAPDLPLTVYSSPLETTPTFAPYPGTLRTGLGRMLSCPYRHPSFEPTTRRRRRRC